MSSCVNTSKVRGNDEAECAVCFLGAPVGAVGGTINYFTWQLEMSSRCNFVLKSSGVPRLNLVLLQQTNLGRFICRQGCFCFIESKRQSLLCDDARAQVLGSCRRRWTA